MTKSAVVPEATKPVTNYKRHTFNCDKCKSKVVVETDYLSDSAAKLVHKCKQGGKNGKGK